MISVVMPALDEAASVVQSIAAFRAALAACNVREYEIIVVDDGSSDDTGRLAANSGAIVVRHPHNVGYGRSIKDGINAASHDVVVLSDADGSYPIHRLPTLLEEFNRGYDLVIAQRLNTAVFDAWHKRLLRRALRGLVQFLAARRVPDVNSGFRIFRKSTAFEYFPTLCDTFSFTTSQTLSYMLGGRFVAFVGVPYQWRQGESKVRLLRDTWRTLQYVIRTVLYYQPMRIFVLCAIMLLGISFVSMTASFIFRVNAAYFLAIGGVLTAILVFCLGLLADLLQHILTRLAAK